MHALRVVLSRMLWPDSSLPVMCACLQSISFSQAYAAAPICTPSRGAIQTGRMASRLGLTSNDTRRVLVSPAQNSGLEPDEVTMAEVAKAGGYATGLVRGCLRAHPWLLLRLWLFVCGVVVRVGHQAN